MLTVSLIDEKTENVPSGTPMVNIPLKTVLELCYTRQKDDKKKGEHGQILPYINNRFGKDYWPDNKISNDGVGFLDLDYMNKESVEAIFNSFEELTQYCPFILAITYSSSYFDESKQKNGLHIFINFDVVNQFQYKNEIRYAFAMICKAILKVTGIDCRISQLFDGDKGEKIIDDTCCKITQKCNLYYSPYKWNDYCEEFDFRTIKPETIQKIKAEYPSLFPVDNSEYTNVLNIQINRDDYEILYPNYEPKIIDRFFEINGNTGNTIRYKICSIFNILFDNDILSKQYINRYFLDGKRCAFYQNNKYVLYEDILRWLIDEGYIRDKNAPELYRSDKGYVIKDYLTEYKDLIVNTIKDHRCITINGETGIGKTYCFADLCKEMNGILIVPFLSMRNLYSSKGLTIVERENQNDFNFDSGCVMVYDRLALLSETQIIGKTIFIDESHILFSDRKFRKNLIQTLSKIKNLADKIIIISATPLDETKLLDSEIELKFTKPRRYVDLYWKDVANINTERALIEKIVDTNIVENKYNKICIFTNRCSRYVYDNLVVRFGRTIHNNVNIFHRDYESFGDIERITKTELLDKKINIGTSLIYNGLNFNNVEDNILVVIECIKGETSYAEVIQAAGRFRKAGIIVYVVSVNQEEDYDYSKMNAEILGELSLNRKLFSYDNDYLIISDVVEQLNNFNKVECNKEAILKRINEAGYFRVVEMEDNIDSSIIPNRKNLLKEAIDRIIKKELQNQELTNREQKLKQDGREYYNSEIKMINEFMYRYGVSSSLLIDLNNSETIQSENKVKYQRLNRTIEKLEKIILASIDDIDYWNNIEEQLKNKWKDITNEKIIKKQGSELKAVIEANKKFHKYFVDYEIRDLFSDNVFVSLVGDLIKENNINNDIKSKKRAAAGKKGGKHTNTYEVTNNMPGNLINKYRLSYGKKFTSRQEFADYCNVNPKQISTWIKLLYINKLA